MKKHYCKNCRYDDTMPNIVGWCRFSAAKKYTGANDIRYRKDFNQTGECLDYKRKWWKFWVRED